MLSQFVWRPTTSLLEPMMGPSDLSYETRMTSKEREGKLYDIYAFNWLEAKV